MNLARLKSGHFMDRPPDCQEGIVLDAASGRTAGSIPGARIISLTVPSRAMAALGTRSRRFRVPIHWHSASALPAGIEVSAILPVMVALTSDTLRLPC